jgi:beta-glucuronidase
LYARDFFIHETTSRWVLRFQAAHNTARVWINGQTAVNHSGGHLPFECDISSFMPHNVSYVKMHLVVAVNNTLTATTLPPGYLHIYNPTYRELETPFDFFNYAGIDRSVLLYSTADTYIEGIAIDTLSIDYNSEHVATSAELTYAITIGGMHSRDGRRVTIELIDAAGFIVANSTDTQSQLVIDKPHLWEPCGMSHTHLCTEQSYLYTLQVSIYEDTTSRKLLDIYRLPHVGIRTIRLTDSQLLVNERPFYFHGANAHEDSDIRGKGFDQVILAKHFNLYGWLHGNAFRTSHYPYADEFYAMADRFGIAIIDETPAVGLRKAQFVSSATLSHHQQVITEMIIRDRNHPSVFMWSIANEPQSNAPEAKNYFETLANFTRSLATRRPITYVADTSYNEDQGIQFFDVICINRYFGWYSQSGRLDQISSLISQDLANWRHRFPTKPILVSEYGADTVAGLHSDPPLMFTEEYQTEFLAAYHVVFDNVSSIARPDTGYLIGELVWNAFDFATDPSITRVAGLNRKGIFTRQRQPKAAAFVMRNRYTKIETVLTEHRTTT